MQSPPITDVLSAAPRADVVVRCLMPSQWPLVLEHLLALDDDDRRLRFGSASSSEAITRYVDSIDFNDGRVIGALSPEGELVGVAHVSITRGVAELGISVLAAARGHGIGVKLGQAALRAAQRAGAHHFRFDYAADNLVMQRLAQRLHMQVRGQGAEQTAERVLRAPEALRRAEAFA